MKACLLFLVCCGLGHSGKAQVRVNNSAELATAVKDRPEGTHILITSGTYKLNGPLEPKAGMKLSGAGIGKTIITHTGDWKPSTRSLPDPEMRRTGMDTQAYLIRLQDNAADITISDLTLDGPQVHGAIFGWKNERLNIHHVAISNTIWTGIRTFGLKSAGIHNCEFVNAGGRWKKGGQPGTKGGITGGAIFCVWTTDSEFSHNRFVRTDQRKEREFYGIKGRQARRCRIHHNTIEVNFSIEFPFENDEDVEIDHNVCSGTISIPKHAGGKVPESGRTFHIHHNWLRSGYAIEFVRNGVEIDHNLFDFDVNRDGGNLISGFGRAAASGPASFHHNLVSNPGRGVIWINEVFNNLDIHHNHIITRTTATPRKSGLFGLNEKADFSTIRIHDNVVECQGQSRPLFRNENSFAADISNNRLVNVSDADRLKNPLTQKPRGMESPLQFECGVHGEVRVNGWYAEEKPKDDRILTP